jgi:hypothetical protein
MSDEWHKGPPPSIGWWPASSCMAKDALRWWDGMYWSCVAFIDDSDEEAARYAGRRSRYQTRQIKWRNRPASWPERSRT